MIVGYRMIWRCSNASFASMWNSHQTLVPHVEESYAWTAQRSAKIALSAEELKLIYNQMLYWRSSSHSARSLVNTAERCLSWQIMKVITKSVKRLQSCRSSNLIKQSSRKWFKHTTRTYAYTQKIDPYKVVKYKMYKYKMCNETHHQEPSL